jgi:DNA-binding transcriptional LysR family regulator
MPQTLGRGIARVHRLFPGWLFGDHAQVLNPWRLRLLVHLETLGTVRAVAEALRMSPSSVSQQLAVLEREARTTLLDHHGRRVALTPAAVVLAAHGREILGRIEAAEADLALRRAEPVGVVRVGSFASGLHALLLPAAARLRQSHPRLRVECVELESHDSLPALRRGELDVALILDFGDGWLPVDARLRRLPLTADPVVLVLPRGHPAAGAAVVDLASLADQHWALDQDGSYFHDLVVRQCRRAGFEPVVVGRYASYSLMLEQVESGLAVAALPELAVDRRYDVVSTALAPAVDRTIHAVTPDGPPPLPAVAAVLDGLVAVGADLAGGR